MEELIEHFYKGSLKFTLQPEDVKTMTWSKQQVLIDSTINSPTVKKYPVNSTFSRLFFKKLIGYLESTHEVHDEFYNYLCSLMKIETSVDKDKFYYRHYIIGNELNNKIIMKETNNMVINGTTGMKTWEAALMITDWAIYNKHLFQYKKVLELGSGVGFAGITIAKFCNTNTITMTDCHNQVLKAICENIKINFPEMDKKETQHETKFMDENHTIGVMRLDWNVIEEIPDDLIPDVLLGADIIYNPSSVYALCNVLKTLIDRNKELDVYIANIIRNEGTYQMFLEALVAVKLSCEKIIPSESGIIKWDQHIQLCLLKIKSIY